MPIKGFFSTDSLASSPKIPTLSSCGSCGLYKTCKSPKMKPTGKGKRKILVVAEAPGRVEDEKGIQLKGKAGKKYRRILTKFGVSLDDDCHKTNAIICRPPDNETPDTETIFACQPNLFKTIQKLKPNAIFLLGGVAIKSLLTITYDHSEEGEVGKWNGYAIPCRKPNSWLIPTYHPSYLLRMNNEVLARMVEKHTKRGIKLAKKKPWKKIPNYKNQVEIIMNTSKAARAIRSIIKAEGIVANDFETNCLKPEDERSEIVSCSICHNGEKTIAYPWCGEVIEATSELFKSSIPKIAANMKFEQRWSVAKLGHSIRKWYWDTMVAAHYLDYRRGVTSLKFQSFVHLGQNDYDSHIKPFLKSTTNSPINRIKELDMRDLLLYNGLDSHNEYHVAMKQIKLVRKRNKERKKSE